MVAVLPPPGDAYRYRSDVGSRFGFVTSITSADRMLDHDHSGQVVRFGTVNRRKSILICCHPW